jgi:hypothetical protein
MAFILSVVIQVEFPFGGHLFAAYPPHSILTAQKIARAPGLGLIALEIGPSFPHMLCCSIHFVD